MRMYPVTPALLLHPLHCFLPTPRGSTKSPGPEQLTFVLVARGIGKMASRKFGLAFTAEHASASPCSRHPAQVPSAGQQAGLLITPRRRGAKADHAPASDDVAYGRGRGGRRRGARAASPHQGRAVAGCSCSVYVAGGKGGARERVDVERGQPRAAEPHEQALAGRRERQPGDVRLLAARRQRDFLRERRARNNKQMAMPQRTTTTCQPYKHVHALHASACLESHAQWQPAGSRAAAACTSQGARAPSKLVSKMAASRPGRSCTHGGAIQHSNGETLKRSAPGWPRCARR